MADRETRIHAYQRTKRVNYLDFDGTDDYVSLPNLGFSGNPDITVEAWYYGNSAGDHTIFSFSGEGVTRQSWITWVQADGRVGLATWNDDHYTSAGTITTGQWYHIAVSYQASNNEVRVYVDGYLKTTGTTGGNLNLSNTTYSIGRRSSSLGYTNGVISEVRVWDSVRTAEQISQYKNTSQVNKDGILKNEIDTTNLVGYWPLDEGTGTNAIDYSSTGDNGTLTNFTGTYWQTGTAPAVFDREYKAHTSRFRMGGIQENLFNGVSAVNFTLPNITDVQGDEIYKSVEGVELEVEYSTRQVDRTIFRGQNRVVSTRLRNIKSVEVTGISIVEYLAKGYTPKGADGTYNFTYSSLDIADCFKQLIDSYNNQNPPLQLYYTDQSIQTTGKTITKTFYNPRNFLVAFQSIFQEADSNWYWYIGADNVVYLQPISDTDDFIFTYGKDFFNASQTTDATKIANRVRVWNNSASRGYTNQDSIDTYGQKIEIIRDDRLNTTGMDNLADYILDTKGEPNNQIKATLVDITAGGSYDISQPLLGKTFTVVNTDETIENKIITTARRNPEKGTVDIVASDTETYISREITDIQNSQFLVNFDTSSPDTYTETTILDDSFVLEDGNNLVFEDSNNFTFEN